MAAIVEARVTWLVVRARARSTWRSIAIIARGEPGWFLLVVVTLVGGATAAVLGLAPRRQTIALGAAAVVLTLLLALARRDAAFNRVLGVAPRRVRVIEGLLWSSPLIGLVAVRSLRDGAAMASAVAAASYLSVGATSNRRSRRPRFVVPGLTLSLPEWTVGVRRFAPILVVALVAGFAGSESPSVVMMALATLTLTTSAFFWGPAEGWLLIHAREQSAGRFVYRKLLLSVGMLSILLLPVVLLAAVRDPSYVAAYLVTLAICLHAHAASVAVKYASYREGRPLDAAGSLVWTITAVAIVVPPIGILLLVWLVRRATVRIADYSSRAPRGA